MKNASLFLLLISTNCIFSQTVNFDRDHPVKSNYITGYLLCKTLIEDKDSNQQIRLNDEYYTGKHIKYVVYSKFKNEIINYFDENGIYEYYLHYSYSTIVAHDLSSNYVLLEHDKITDYYDNNPPDLTISHQFMAWDNTKHEMMQGEIGLSRDGYYNDIIEFYHGLWMYKYYYPTRDYFNALYCLRKEYELLNCGNRAESKKSKMGSGECSTVLYHITSSKYYLRDYYGCIETGNQYIQGANRERVYLEAVYDDMMESCFKLRKFDKAISYADSIIKMPNGAGLEEILAHLIKGMALINSSKKDKGCEELGVAVELGSKEALRLIHNCCNQPCSNEIVLADDGNEIYNENISAKKIITIPLIRGKDDLFEVAAELNDAIKLKFILDSGASDVSVPPNIVKSLIESGNLKQTDFYGEQEYRLADGSTIKSSTFIIHKLKIGDLVFEEIKASIGSSNDAPLLLGQNLLKKFGTVTLDYYNNKLVINQP